MAQQLAYWQNDQEKEEFLNQTIGRFISAGITGAFDYKLDDAIIFFDCSFAELSEHREDIRCILTGYNWELLRIHKRGAKTKMYSGIKILDIS